MSSRGHTRKTVASAVLAASIVSACANSHPAAQAHVPAAAAAASLAAASVKPALSLSPIAAPAPTATAEPPTIAAPTTVASEAPSRPAATPTTAPAQTANAALGKLPFYGLPCGDLSKQHVSEPESQGAVWDSAPGLGEKGGTGFRFVFDNCTTSGQGYNTTYDQVLPLTGVSFPAARQEVERWSLPQDARLVWARSFDTCAAADYVSPTVRSVVPGSDGNVTVVFGSDDVEGNDDGSYLPTRLSGATFGTATTLTPDGFTC